MSFSLLVGYSSSYLLFFALLHLAKKQGANRLFASGGTLVRSPLLLALHAAGILLFGVLPFWLAHAAVPLFFNTADLLRPSTLVSLLVVVLILWLSPRLAEKAYTGKLSSFTQKPVFITSYLRIYFLLRILFIVAYEVWFRGFLLTASIAAVGAPLAVCLNILLYTLLHVVNGKKEMIGCVPFGLVLCCLCLWQGAVWPAIAIHLALTVPYEAVLLKKQTTKTANNEGFHHRRRRLHRA